MWLDTGHYPDEVGLPLRESMGGREGGTISAINMYEFIGARLIVQGVAPVNLKERMRQVVVAQNREGEEYVPWDYDAIDRAIRKLESSDY